MKSIDLRDLFAGLIDVILISMALGQYHRLEKFAIREAAKPMKPLPTFHFPKQ